MAKQEKSASEINLRSGNAMEDPVNEETTLAETDKNQTTLKKNAAAAKQDKFNRGYPPMGKIEP